VVSGGVLAAVLLSLTSGVVTGASELLWLATEVVSTAAVTPSVLLSGELASRVVVAAAVVASSVTC